MTLDPQARRKLIAERARLQRPPPVRRRRRRERASDLPAAFVGSGSLAAASGTALDDQLDEALAAAPSLAVVAAKRSSR